MKVDIKLLSNVSKWSTHSFSSGSNTFDCITLFTKPNDVEFELIYRRNKSMIYNDKIRDTVPFYASSIDYLNALNLLNAVIPEMKMAH